MKKTYLYSMLALCVSAACHAETYPAPIGPSQSDFGGVGLLQTPTARMAREGEISLNYRDNDQYRYYSALMNPLMILVKIIKLRWIHILSYDQMVSRKINNQTTRCANSI
ncbi:YjbH domain-containing protein, partial [Enterobacter hormaechei]